MTSELGKLSVLLLVVGLGLAEVFTSYDTLVRMIDSEAAVGAHLTSYIQAEEQRLDKLKQALDTMRSHMTAASKERDRHLNNPINLYFLIRRIATDWSAVKALVNTDATKDVIQHAEAMFPLPGSEDVEGATVGLLRLQDTYQFNTTQISLGLLHTVHGSPEFTARDCYEIGRSAFVRDDHYHALMWMEEGLRRLDSEEETHRTMERLPLLDHLRQSYLQQGNPRHSLALIHEMLAIDPTHKQALAARAHVERLLAGEKTLPLGPMKNERPPHDDPAERDRYEALCRGEGVMNDPARVSKLKCYYLTRNNPRLLLSPAKVEEVSDRMPMVIFHDILLESEMELMKKLSSSRLRRAMEFNRTEYAVIVTTTRTGKSAWLREGDHEIVTKTNQRFGDYTGMDVSTVESHQMVNYGLGGQFEPHFDFAPIGIINPVNTLREGNRIASLVAYISDVDAGGATVFPNIGARVVPKKGSAAFWYNLLRSGQALEESRHAACPVLMGNKWTIVKSFHERGQEFRRPCSLDPTE